MYNGDHPRESTKLITKDFCRRNKIHVHINKGTKFVLWDLLYLSNNYE